MSMGMSMSRRAMGQWLPGEPAIFRELFLFM